MFNYTAVASMYFFPTPKVLITSFFRNIMNIQEIQQWYEEEMATMNRILEQRKSRDFLINTLKERRGEGYWYCRRNT